MARTQHRANNRLVVATVVSTNVRGLLRYRGHRHGGERSPQWRVRREHSTQWRCRWVRGGCTKAAATPALNISPAFA